MTIGGQLSFGRHREHCVFTGQVLWVEASALAPFLVIAAEAKLGGLYSSYMMLLGLSCPCNAKCHEVFLKKLAVMTLGAKLHGSQWQSQLQMQRISSCSTRTMKFWKCWIQDMGQSLQQSHHFSKEIGIWSWHLRYATWRHLDISQRTRLQRSNAASHMRCSIAFSLDGERFIQKKSSNPVNRNSMLFFGEKTWKPNCC